MAAGNLKLGIGLDVKQLNKSIRQFENTMKRSVINVKNLFLAAGIGRFLFAGADGYLNEFQAKARAKLNLKEIGFGNEIAEQLFTLTNEFEKLGYNADQANDAFISFVAEGKAQALKSVGIVLDKNTRSTLANATANERLNWILKDGKTKLEELNKATPANVKVLSEMRKTTDDLKKALGAGFLSALSGIINAFGGVSSAMKVALVAFTAYKIATIIGNTAIGISKALALGSVFAAPAAFAIGIASLTSLLALVGASAVAFNSIDNVSATSAPPGGQVNSTNVVVDIKEDEFGRRVEGNYDTNNRAKSNFGASN